MAVRRNILVFHQGALGDFVITWPLALGLARVFAQSRLFYVTAGQKGALAENALRVESADVEAGWHQLYSSEPKLPEPAARLLDGAQQIISFVGGSDDLWAKNVRSIAPEAHLVTLATTPAENFRGHITDFLAEQLKPWPVIEAAMSQMLRSIGARGLGATPSPQGPVVLHPGAGSGKKCWPVEHFIELAGRLRQRGRRVQAILGEVELEQWPAERIRAMEACCEVVRPSRLVDLLAIISGASAFVGNDSGPGHLAGIVGVPTVSIFGPKDPVRWRPLGPNVHVLSGEWAGLSVSRVLDAIMSRK
jgi:ADP-heptose:LPS heptosyltransferase